MPRKPTAPSVSKSESSKPIRQILESAQRGELVIVVGSGISLALTNNKTPALSWKGLIANGFDYALRKGKISDVQFTSWQPQRESNDIDELLGAAEFVGRRLDATGGILYSNWLKETFQSVESTNKEMISAVKVLQNAGIPLCTLNYDSLLEKVTGLHAITFDETSKVTAWMRNENAAIFHLHGSWEKPHTCILGIRDYQTTLQDEMRDTIQRSLSSFRRLLFMGCGGTFEDPNFSALIQWLRANLMGGALEHYALVQEDQVARRHMDPAWHGFVEPIGFGTRHGELARFLTDNFKTLASGHLAISKVRSPGKPTLEVDKAELLRRYRTFLLKDSGQMSIDGVGADMETSKQRFDLERLFVPLKVLPIPPDFPSSDPLKEEKRQAWLEKNKDPILFGQAFAKHRHLALLALPGGGKTLLLKRLAVAYSDPTRLKASDDSLPVLDLTAVVIRCREWREHIHTPIYTLLGNLPQITGQPTLEGLREALMPLFKEGKVLLLIDGLDEIHEDALRSSFVENLEKFVTEYPRNRLVVTSREAGFGLVAPNVARFCNQWRLAGLEREAITALCLHWHILMVGNTPESEIEGKRVAQVIIRNDALRRLGENPLLLTMLLVVKQGAGRLPPDRVSLYRKAVEVLLDTWNIKGHEPLNPKEAVPQLAFVAYEMLRSGKQTATEKELLTLIEESREKVPQIRRYAKDRPDEFLKRVELRSSLVLEAGRQAALSGTVPIYQFRHLTFQEYLAAFAAVEGHYAGYDKADTLLTPLKDYLIAEDWKEVIPMAAVLAVKQAEPLMAELVRQGEEEASADASYKKEAAPIAVARLGQCLAEESEAAPETLASALRLIVLFGRLIRNDGLRILSRGPYGNELWNQALVAFRSQARLKTDLLTSCAEIAYYRISATVDPAKLEGKLEQLLTSQDETDQLWGLLAISGGQSNQRARLDVKEVPFIPGLADLTKHRVRPYLWSTEPEVREAAFYAWGWMVHLTKDTRDIEALDQVAEEWVKYLVVPRQDFVQIAPSVLALYLGKVPRDQWKPHINDEQTAFLREFVDLPRNVELTDFAYTEAVALLAYHSRAVVSDENLAKFLQKSFSKIPVDKAQIETMIAELRVSGKKRRKRV